jgi:hypothetical protein
MVENHSVEKGKYTELIRKELYRLSEEEKEGGFKFEVQHD